MKQTPAKTIYT